MSPSQGREVERDAFILLKPSNNFYELFSFICCKSEKFHRFSQGLITQISPDQPMNNEIFNAFSSLNPMDFSLLELN